MAKINSSKKWLTEAELLVQESLQRVIEVIESWEITIDVVRELFWDQLLYLVTGDERWFMPKLEIEDINVSEFWQPIQGKKMTENPLQFTERVYVEFIWKWLTKWHVWKVDEKLYRALENWSRKDENIIPETILPTKTRKQDSTVLHELELTVYKRVASIKAGRKRKT